MSKISISKPFDNDLTNVHSIAGGAFKIQTLKSIRPLIRTSFLLQQSSDIKVVLFIWMVDANAHIFQMEKQRFSAKFLQSDFFCVSIRQDINTMH